MTPALLDEYLTVMVRHRVRAAKLPDGTALELDPGGMAPPEIDIPEDVAGGWKRPADLSAED